MRGVKQLLKNSGSAILHFLFQAQAMCRLVDWVTYERWRHRRRQIEKRLRAKGSYGDEVLFGPFKGLRYNAKWASNRFEKIIGAYEFYLHDFLEEICRKPYSEIINVGCAEGYYVVGLARRIPGALVYAYDINQELLEHCQEIARLNGVANQVVTRAFCDCAELNRIEVRRHALVFSDCEGYELDLLDPGKVPMLRTADILVELHDFKNRAISQTIRERFAGTHALKVVQTEGMTYRNYPILRHLTFPEIYAMTAEERGEIMEWYFLEAKTFPSPERAGTFGG
jgi:hypothetical protein